jgi:hypothetical protein
MIAYENQKAPYEVKAVAPKLQMSTVFSPMITLLRKAKLSAHVLPAANSHMPASISERETNDDIWLSDATNSGLNNVTMRDHQLASTKDISRNATHIVP